MNIPAEKQAFQIGDRVVCIDDTASFRRLQVGHEYIVEAAYDGSPTVIVNGAYHCLERFRPINEKAKRQPRRGESRAISVPGGSPDESLTVPTQIAGSNPTQRETVSGEPGFQRVLL